MKNTIYSLFLLAVGGLLGYFVHGYSIPTDADIDLEIEGIQVEETIDGFVTQSELSSSEINENLQTRIDKLQSIRAKVAVNLNKQRRRIRNIDKKITRLQNSKIFSLYSCTDGEREIDETYTGCKALSGGGEFNDGDSVCDTTYPSASCTNNGNSTNTATRDHCGETYTDYDTYLAAYNASPSCTPTNTATRDHCGETYTDYDTYLAAYNASPSCTPTNTATRDHCGETYTDYDTYLAAYNASPSCT